MNVGSSQPQTTTCVAAASNSGVIWRGRYARTSIPSAASPNTTACGTPASGSIPADSPRTAKPCRVARRFRYSAAIRLFAEPCRQTKRIVLVRPSPSMSILRDVLIDRASKNHDAYAADRGGDVERQLRRRPPQQTADERRWRDCKASNEIVQPHDSPSERGSGEIDDQCFSRRLSHFAQATDDEGDNKPGKVRRPDDGDWHERE